METGASLVLRTVDALGSGTAVPCPQDDSDLRPWQAAAPKLNRDTGHMDWNRDAFSLHNLVRGLSPRPGAHGTVVLDGQELELKIYRTAVLSDAETDALGLREDCAGAAPGTAFTDHRSFIAVRCCDGLLSLKELQAPAKKRMDARSFLAGWRGASR